MLFGYFFFGKETSARAVHGFQEQGGMWVAGNRLHFYIATEGSSDYLLLSRDVVDCIGPV